MKWSRIRITAVATSSVTMTATVAALAAATSAAAAAAAVTVVADTDGPGVYRKTPMRSSTALTNPKHKLTRTIESLRLVYHFVFPFPSDDSLPFRSAPISLIAFFVISFLFPFLSMPLLCTTFCLPLTSKRKVLIPTAPIHLPRHIDI